MAGHDDDDNNNNDSGGVENRIVDGLSITTNVLEGLSWHIRSGTSLASSSSDDVAPQCDT